MKSKILAGIGIGALIGAIFMAIKNAKKEAEDEFESTQADEDLEEETFFEKIVRKVKTYWPTAVLAAISIFCIVSSISVSMKSTAAAVIAYKLTADSFDKYKAAGSEVLGNKKEAYISAKAAEYKMKETHLDRNKVKQVDSSETLLYDPISKAYFYMELKEVRELSKSLNDSLVNNGGDKHWVPYRMLKNGLGLSKVPVNFDEDDLGWNAVDGDIQIGFDVQVLNDGERCIVLTYRVAPHYDFECV